MDAFLGTLKQALGIFSQVLALFGQYPEILVFGIGPFAGWIVTVMIERYFLPQYTDAADRRRQQGLTWIICWVFSTFFTAVLWALLDPADRPAVRIGVSMIVGVGSFAVYPAIGKVVTAFFPKIGSAWAKTTPSGDGSKPSPPGAGS